MIPSNATNPAVLEQLTYYLRQEIWRAQSERFELESQWIRYDLGYRGKPKETTKDFPFEGAANLVIPVIATDVDTIFSRIMGILFSPDNLWSCRALNESMVQFAPKLQDFLEWAQEHELGVYDAVADWCMELCKLGTGVLKQRYRREMKQVYQYRETDFGTVEQQLMMLIKDSPRVEHVSLYDFYIPASSTNVQEAPWCAERIMLGWGQLMERARAGVYMLPAGIGNWYAQSRASRNEEVKQRSDMYVPSFADRFEIHEFWLDYDLSGLGRPPQAIVATLHIPSMSLLRVDYNPFFNQDKPYSIARYLRQEKRFYGIGLCEMLAQFQDEISTQHNQRIDSATLANSTMMKAKKGIGIRENEPIIPGRWFLLDNMEDVQTLPMGQRFDSTVPYEEMTLQYATKRTGVNDYIQGNPTAAVGYGPASTTQAMLQEGAKRFDQVMREARRCLSETGVRVTELYQQYNQKGKEYLVMGQQDGAVVHQILQFPMEIIRTGVAIELTATSGNLNKEQQIRTNTIISQMVVQYYQQVMQAMSYVVNPQVPPQIKQLAMEMVQGGTILIKRIMDDYGLKDGDKIIPPLTNALQGQQQQLAMMQQGAGGQPQQQIGPGGPAQLPPGPPPNNALGGGAPGGTAALAGQAAAQLGSRGR